MDAGWITAPVIQAGFAGFAAILLGVLVWLISRLLGLLKSNTEVISGNTSAIRDCTKTAEQSLALQHSTRELLLKRPCLQGHDGEE